MNPDEILSNAADAARNAIADFGLAYHLKPNALLAGQGFLEKVLVAAETLGRTGRTRRLNEALPECPKLGQRLLVGLPVIVSSRPDDVVVAVLVGDIELLKLPTA